MTRIVIRAQDFSIIARELKAAGENDLRRELFRGLQRSSKGARQNVRDALPGHMPDNYAATLNADLKLSTSAKGGKSPAVRIRGKGRRKNRFLGPLDRGVLRHPVFGGPGWAQQAIQPGFWTNTLQREADDVERQLTEAMAEVIRKIAD